MLGVRTHNSVSLARPAGVTVRKERQGRTRRLELLREQAKVSATPEPGGSAGACRPFYCLSLASGKAFTSARTGCHALPTVGFVARWLLIN